MDHLDKRMNFSINPSCRLLDVEEYSAQLLVKEISGSPSTSNVVGDDVVCIAVDMSMADCLF